MKFCLPPLFEHPTGPTEQQIVEEQPDGVSRCKRVEPCWRELGEIFCNTVRESRAH